MKNLKYNSNQIFQFKKNNNNSYHLSQIKSPRDCLNLNLNLTQNNIENFPKNNLKKIQRIIDSNICIIKQFHFQATV